jgi:hypothetical protein
MVILVSVFAAHIPDIITPGSYLPHPASKAERVSKDAVRPEAARRI